MSEKCIQQNNYCSRSAFFLFLFSFFLNLQNQNDEHLKCRPPERVESATECEKRLSVEKANDDKMSSKPAGWAKPRPTAETPMASDDKSGKATDPSKYNRTCLILGLIFGSE